MAERQINKQNAIEALIKSGFTIISDNPKKKDVDLIISHPNNASKTLDVKVYSRMAFIRRINGSGIHIVFTYDKTGKSYLYNHDTLFKEFSSIITTKSWLRDGLYTFNKIKPEDLDTIEKYRL